MLIFFKRKYIKFFKLILTYTNLFLFKLEKKVRLFLILPLKLTIKNKS